jgi:hypothetical protein
MVMLHRDFGRQAIVAATLQLAKQQLRQDIEKLLLNLPWQRVPTRPIVAEE